METPATSVCRHAISRMCALWLITLIVLPFTAPFATYDLDHPESHSSHDWLAKDKTVSDGKVLAPPELTVGPPALTIIAVTPALPDSRCEERPLQFTVLRI